MTLWILRVAGTPHTFRTSAAATRYARIARIARIARALAAVKRGKRPRYCSGPEVAALKARIEI